MHLSELSWTAAEAADPDVVAVPVGSTEQHGPHAPLGTDVLTAEAVTEAGVAAADVSVLVAPTIPVGVAEEHRHFAGTLWVSEDAFRSYVRECVASIASHGWERVVLVNGHGGNTDALREVCGRLTRDGTAYVVPFTWFEAIDVDDLDIEGVDGGTDAEGGDLGMGHAGPLETSLLQAIDASLVDQDELEAAAADAAAGWGEWQSGTNLAFDSVTFTDNGVVGDPTVSSPALGTALRDAAGDALAALFRTVATRDFPNG